MNTALEQFLNKTPDNIKKDLEIYYLEILTSEIRNALEHFMPDRNKSEAIIDMAENAIKEYFQDRAYCVSKGTIKPLSPGYF